MVTEEQLTKTLNELLANDNLPQAYLFISQNNSAKSVAESFAAKITGKDFPNLDTIIFDCSVDNNIDAIREVLKLASLMPVVSSHKVVVMTGMEKASVQMLNALLKTLEEPPKHCVFLLLSTQPLISTVMSRCQVFRLYQASGIQDLSDELKETVTLITQAKSNGIAERMALVNKLADLEDDLLSQAIQQWLNMQVETLKSQPENFTAVRSTIETLQNLRGNFNKKMVLSNFVTNSLV